jgi:hypothetical protein
MAGWWNDGNNAAREIRKLRADINDPDGKWFFIKCGLVIAVLGFFIIPKTIKGYHKDQATKQEMRRWAQLPKEQQKAAIKKGAIETHAEYKKKLDEICIANETRWKHSEVNCSYIKEDFLRNYCPPTHLFKDVSDPVMCAKLKKTSNNW